MSKLTSLKHPHYLSVFNPTILTETTRLPGNVPLPVEKHFKSQLKPAKVTKNGTDFRNHAEHNVKSTVTANAAEACAHWLKSQSGKEDRLPKTIPKLSNVLMRHCKVKLFPENIWVLSKLFSQGVISTCQTCDSICYHTEKLVSRGHHSLDEMLDPNEAVYQQVGTWIKTQPTASLPRSLDGLRSHISGSSVNYNCDPSDVIPQLLQHGLIELVGLSNHLSIS